MRIVSESQLTFIRNDYQRLIDEQAGEYCFEGTDRSIFDNLLLFIDDRVFDKIRSDHSLHMTKCERIWNKYFWYLRYASDVRGTHGSAQNHQQPVFKIFEALYDVCGDIDENQVKTLETFATDFGKQPYINFDYFHPAITNNGVSLRSSELLEIANVLGVHSFDIDRVDRLIEANIDNSHGELLTFRNPTDSGTSIRIDTFSAGQSQIHPIDILITCKYENKGRVDALLVKWWSTFWTRLGPFVAISPIDKFEVGDVYRDRKRIEV